jgi:hypothetical protein
MSRPCRCDRPESCRLCWLWHHDARYRALWETTPTPAPAARRPLPCVYLGPVTERAGCLCPRRDRRRCDRGHGDVRQAVECESCPDYEPDG